MRDREVGAPALAYAGGESSGGAVAEGEQDHCEQDRFATATHRFNDFAGNETPKVLSCPNTPTHHTNPVRVTGLIGCLGVHDPANGGLGTLEGVRFPAM